jgi:hypothetical protein
LTLKLCLQMIAEKQLSGRESALRKHGRERRKAAYSGIAMSKREAIHRTRMTSAMRAGTKPDSSRATRFQSENRLPPIAGAKPRPSSRKAEAIRNAADRSLDRWPLESHVAADRSCWSRPFGGRLLGVIVTQAKLTESKHKKVDPDQSI